MSNKLSQLDSVRGAAAVYVVVYHTRYFAHGALAPLFLVGPEAVILFFLLSGFVISYSSEQRLRLPGGTATYFLHRFRRIYPLFIVALLLTWIMASIRAGGLVAVQVPSLAANLLMLQDLKWLKQGAWFSVYLGHDPLWSLSYEWWFYIMFVPVLLTVSFRSQRWAVLSISCIAAATYRFLPSQLGLWLGYFYIWWAGVEMAREFRKEGTVTWRGQRGTLMGLAILAIAWSVPVVVEMQSHAKLRIGFEPVIELRHTLAALAFVTGAIYWRSKSFIGFKQTVGWFGSLAPISYALYVFHAPFVQTAEHLSRGFALGLILFVLIPICFLAEMVLQPRINRILGRLVPKLPPQPQMDPPAVTPMDVAAV
jgi:peptidoglycan/LPS O-acetylase OafA/YrhL